METILGIDYPTWWFLVIGGLFSGYAILDGFDFGAGATRKAPNCPQGSSAERLRETKDHSRPTKCETLAPLAPPFGIMHTKIGAVNSAFEEK